MVESQPSKLLVAGSIPVSRSTTHSALSAHSATSEGVEADVAQLAEHVLGKDEVTSSILVIGSSLRSRESGGAKVDWRQGTRKSGSL